MSKRSISGRPGKQLYQNKIFNRGMLYNSSEMLDGSARIIDNLDISPMGDSASPRAPYKVAPHKVDMGKHTIPIQFKQSKNDFHYIEFKNVITEDDFANDIESDKDFDTDSILAYSRNNNGLNISQENSGLTPATTAEVTGGLDEDAISNAIRDAQEATNLISYDKITEDEIAIHFKHPIVQSLGMLIQTPSKLYFHLEDKLIEIDVGRSYSRSGVSAVGITAEDYKKIKSNNTFFTGGVNPLTHLDISYAFLTNAYRTITEYTEDGQPEYLYYVLVSNECSVYDIHNNTVVIPTPTGDNIKINSDELIALPVTTSNTTVSVIDGDTVKLGAGLTKSYRLLGINCPEKGEKWYKYGKEFLTQLLDSSNIDDLTYYTFGTDDYKRDLIYLYVKFKPTESTPAGKWCCVNNIMLREGLARKAYIRDVYPLTGEMSEDEVNAKDAGIRIHDHTKADPFYEGIINNIHYPTLEEAENKNVSWHLEIVTLKESKPISNILTNHIEKLSYVYVDYLDSIMFIGRLYYSYGDSPVRTGLYYKGMMQLKYVGGDLRVICPPNGLEGTQPDVVDAAMTGYNLLNKDLLNLKINKEGLPLYIKALIVTPETSDSMVITTATRGETVIVKPLVNETNLTDNKTTNATLGTLYKSLTIDEDYDFSTLPNGTVFQASFKYYGSNTPHTLKVTHTTLDNSVLVFIDGIFQPIAFPPLDSSVFAFADPIIIDTITTSYSVVSLDQINNWDDFIATYGNSEDAELMVMGKWQISEGGDFVDVGGYSTPFGSQAYSVSGVTVTRVPGNLNNLEYTIKNSAKLMFKLVLTPCVHLNGYYFPKPLQEVSLATTLPIGEESVYLNSEDVRANIDIKNATRITVFNRQICLFGPHTVSNVLMFSKFERPWYFPFPYYTIEVDEPIVWVHNYNNTLIVFGEKHIHMLKTEASILEATLLRIYDNLSISTSDIDLVLSVGNYLMFFNNNRGHLLVPNIYSDDPKNIKIYKLTDNINNMLLDPQQYMYTILSDQNYRTNYSDITVTYNSFVQSNVINIVASYNIDGSKDHLVVIYKYDLTYKHWTTYNLRGIIDSVISTYICEPNFGTQFLIYKHTTEHPLAYYMFVQDKINSYTDVDENGAPYNIDTTIDSGYLNVDILNDKRFKDLIIEFDNVKNNGNMSVACNFFIDNKPMLLSSDLENAILVDKNGDQVDVLAVQEDIKDMTILGSHVVDSIVGTDFSTTYSYGTVYKIGNNLFSVSGRFKLRIPLYGKGRLPSFILRVASGQYYELLSYSLVYKEKSINIRR